MDCRRALVRILPILGSLVIMVVFAGCKSAPRYRWQATYDDQGRTTSVTAPGGNTTRFEYVLDDQQRIRRIVKRIPGEANVTFEFDRFGRRTGMTDSNGTTFYGYDSYQHLISVRRDGHPALSYEYDAADRIRSIAVDAWRITYEYDFLGRIARIGTPAGNIVYEYQAASGKVLRHLPNGITTITENSPDGRLASISHVSPSQHILLQLTYSYRPDGLIRSIRKLSEAGESTVDYEYDATGRLMSVSTPNDILKFVHDQFGNVAEVRRGGAMIAKNLHDWSGRIVEHNGVEVSADGAGNLTRFKVGNAERIYSFDKVNRISAASSGSATIRYGYDGDGNIVSRVGPKETMHFAADPLSNAWRPLAVNMAGVETYYLWDESGPLLEMGPSGSHFYLHNHLGSVVGVVDANGSVKLRDYDIFGMPHEDSAQPLEAGFAGLIYDAEAQVYLTRNRAYAPLLSRFLQREPARVVPFGDQKELAPYSYCGGDPVNYVDRDGATPVKTGSSALDGSNNGRYGWGLVTGVGTGGKNGVLEVAKQANGRFEIIDTRASGGTGFFGAVRDIGEMAVRQAKDAGGKPMVLDWDAGRAVIHSGGSDFAPRPGTDVIYIDPSGQNPRVELRGNDIGGYVNGLTQLRLNSGRGQPVGGGLGFYGPGDLLKQLGQLPGSAKQMVTNFDSHFLKQHLDDLSRRDLIPEEGAYGNDKSIKVVTRDGTFFVVNHEHDWVVLTPEQAAKFDADHAAAYATRLKAEQAKETSRQTENEAAMKVETFAHSGGNPRLDNQDRMMAETFTMSSSPGRNENEGRMMAETFARTASSSRIENEYSVMAETFAKTGGADRARNEAQMAKETFARSSRAASSQSSTRQDSLNESAFRQLPSSNDKDSSWGYPAITRVSPDGRLRAAMTWTSKDAGGVWPQMTGTWNIYDDANGGRLVGSGYNMFDLLNNGQFRVMTAPGRMKVESIGWDTATEPTYTTFSADTEYQRFQGMGGNSAGNPFQTTLQQDNTLPRYGFGPSGNIEGIGAMDSSNVGGIYLKGAAEALRSLGTLTGVAYDKASGKIVLLSRDNGSIQLPELRVDDLATVFRTVYERGESPWVTIDPDPKNPRGPLMIIRQADGTANTFVGWVLFEADRIMKGYSLGKDNQSQALIQSHVPDYSKVVEKMFSPGGGSTWERFWIVPAEVKRNRDDNSGATIFEIPLKVNAQRMVLENGKLRPAPVQTPSAGGDLFRRWFTQHYDEIAAEIKSVPPQGSGFSGPISVYPELRRIALMSAIAERLRDLGVPFPLWLRNQPIRQAPFATTTPAITAKQGKVSIYGGVTLSPTDDIVKDVNNPAQLLVARELIAKALDPKQILKPVTLERNGEIWKAIAMPGNETKDVGANGFHETDLAIPVGYDGELRLDRFYNSYFDSSGEFGSGWTLNLPRLQRLQQPMKRIGDSAQLKTVYQMTSPLGTYSGVFSQPKFVEAAGRELLLSMRPSPVLGVAPVKSADGKTVAAFLGDGQRMYFDGNGDLIAWARGSMSLVYRRNRLHQLYLIEAWNSGRLEAGIHLKCDVQGRIIFAQDNAGRVATYRYDDSGHLMQVLSSMTRINYSYRSNLLTSVERNGSAPIHFEYGPQGQLISRDEGSGKSIRYGIERSEGGIKVQAWGDRKAMRESARYDSAFRPLFRSYPDGSSAEWTWAQNGSSQITLKDASGELYKISSSATGASRVVEMPSGGIYRMEHDDFGRLLSLSRGSQLVFTNQWFRDGQLASISFANTVLTQHAGDYGTDEIMLHAPTTGSSLKEWLRAKLDTFGRIISVQDYSGIDVRINYDGSGLPSELTTGRSSVCIRRDANSSAIETSWGYRAKYMYDPKAHTLARVDIVRGTDIAYGQYEGGRLVRAHQFDGSEWEISYIGGISNGDRIRQVKTPGGYNLSYTYDGDGNIKTVTYNNGYRIEYTYDKQGHTTSMTELPNSSRSRR
jgi:RHS repeat-associated protein